MGERSTKKFKIVLLGEGRVGKTSILLRYIKGEYNDQQVSTLQASYLDKRLLVDNRRVALSLWDTAGQERFHALGPIYYRDADGALLVYDITDAESFRKVRTWVRELRRIVGDDISICIAGNKSDLHRNRKVPEDEAKRYAESVGAAHFDTSAKLNRGLEDAFVELTRRMLGRTGGKKKKGSALIADDEDDEPLAKPPTSKPPTSKTRSQSQTQQAQTHAELNRTEEVPRSRGGGRGQPIQIVEDDDGFTPGASKNTGLRVRGATHVDTGKAKSGCC
ncbi:ras-related protein rab-21-like [Plasmopara halstedii]|uniref:Ras-related protein Rab-21 n=1 Tax=Plasmopara halstedii TaxID=4781 RepID=A0A0P1AVI4_PLAHL|nr:ras-related protein rab-21-like [Plasmopara halstedii]CEG46356.1 ras-related protein rab-21-like [Plasmopara halstedii]|eukprot:XP_024582725.1 ras-related protein rab-21-like [Plasmopara halstedii]